MAISLLTCDWPIIGNSRNLYVGILWVFRYKNVLKVDPNIIPWKVSQGIPFEDIVLDAVYPSHIITHVDRDVATFVTRECYRTLKVGGVI